MPPWQSKGFGHLTIRKFGSWKVCSAIPTEAVEDTLIEYASINWGDGAAKAIGQPDGRQCRHGWLALRQKRPND
jgi:hypothetical protein